MSELTQTGLIKVYFIHHPNQKIRHSEVVDWATEEWERRTGKTMRYAGGKIRRLLKDNFLTRVARGVYKYDPDFVQNPQREDFTKAQQTETGKKMFIRLYELAKKASDKELTSFCSDVLDVFERHNMNGHIEWKR